MCLRSLCEIRERSVSRFRGEAEHLECTDNLRTPEARCQKYVIVLLELGSYIFVAFPANFSRNAVSLVSSSKK